MVVCGFSELERAGAAAEAIVRAGLPVSALEYIDETMLGVISRMSPGVLPGGVEAALIVEVETLHESLDDALSQVEAHVAEAGGSSRRAVGPAEQTRIWEARRTSGGAFGLLFPDSYTHDFAVPRDRIVEVLRGVAAITETHRVDVVTVAHLGDGNIHPKLVYDGREAGAYERVIDASNAILELVLAHGGHAQRRARNRAREARRDGQTVQPVRARHAARRAGLLRSAGHPQPRQGRPARR